MQECLIAMASFMVEHGLQGTQALIVAIFRLSCPKACGILVPEPRIEPVWPTSAGGFLAPGPGKSNLWVQKGYSSHLSLPRAGPHYSLL